MRQSFLFVTVIRMVAVSANVVSLVVERIAASFKPAMRRHCYVHANGSDGTGRDSWRLKRRPNPIARHGESFMSPAGLSGHSGNVWTGIPTTDADGPLRRG
jgi:hypothetical protein